MPLGKWDTSKGNPMRRSNADPDMWEWVLAVPIGARLTFKVRRRASNLVGVTHDLESRAWFQIVTRVNETRFQIVTRVNEIRFQIVTRVNEIRFQIVTRVNEIRFQMCRRRSNDAPRRHYVKVVTIDAGDAVVRWSQGADIQVTVPHGRGSSLRLHVFFLFFFVFCRST